MRFRTNWNRVERLSRTQQSVEFTSNVSAFLCQGAGVRELSVGRCRDSRRADGRYLRPIRCEGCEVSCDEFNNLLTIALGSLELRRQRLNERASEQLGLSGASAFDKTRVL